VEGANLKKVLACNWATCHKAGHAKENQPQATRSCFTLLRQLCNLIPNHLVPGLARQYDAESKSRTFKPWSYVVSLIYA